MRPVSYPYRPYITPGLQNIPIHASDFESSASPMYQPWPQSGNYGYPVPCQNHGCCNNGSFQSCNGFRPYYPHRSQPFHCCSSFAPPCHFPAEYVPPTYYPMDQYVSEGGHQCVCSGHQPYPYEQKSNQNVKIEEHEPESEPEPEVDRQGINTLSKNYPSPVVWVPQAYMKQKGDSSHTPTAVQNGWFPLDLNSFKSLMESQDKSKAKNQPSEGSMKQISGVPLPDEKSKENGDAAAAQKLPILDFIPVGADGKVDSDRERKLRVPPKIIPVKQIEAKADEEHPSVVRGKETVSKQAGSSSTQKQSKLPPVCLRVDPLPKKGNGSRSLIPGHNRQSLEKNKTSEPRKEIKTIPVTAKASVDVKETNELEPRKETKPTPATTVNEEEVVMESVKEGQAETARKKLSEAEAAIILQSVYRGYEVRRWESLKKLKQLCRISEQVDEIKTQMHALGSLTVKQVIERQKIVIGETIMSLLLQLDTVQGLHPSLREIRKSLANELVNMQEAIDSLKVSESVNEEMSLAKPTDVNSEDAFSPVSTEDNINEEDDDVTKTDKNESSETSSAQSSELEERCPITEAPVPHMESPMGGITETGEAIEQSSELEERCPITESFVPHMESPMEGITETGEAIEQSSELEERCPITESFVPHMESPMEAVTETGEAIEQSSELEERCPITEAPVRHMVYPVQGLTETGKAIAQSSELEERCPITDAPEPNMESPVEGVTEIGEAIEQSSKLEERCPITETPVPHMESPVEAVTETEAAMEKKDSTKGEVVQSSSLTSAVEDKTDKTLCENEFGSSLQDNSSYDPAKPEMINDENMGVWKVPQQDLIPENEESESDMINTTVSPTEADNQMEPYTSELAKEITAEEKLDMPPVSEALVEQPHKEDLSGYISAQKEEHSVNMEGATAELYDNRTVSLDFESVCDPSVEETTSLETTSKMDPMTSVQEEVSLYQPVDIVKEGSLGEGQTALENNEPMDGNQLVMEHNQSLKEMMKMMEKLMETGKEQLDTISSLTHRVNDLEKKLSKKKKLKMARKAAKTTSCAKTVKQES